MKLHHNHAQLKAAPSIVVGCSDNKTSNAESVSMVWCHHDIERGRENFKEIFLLMTRLNRITLIYFGILIKRPCLVRMSNSIEIPYILVFDVT